ncbi:MAG: DUF1670 domain-containing protein [Chloroflexi bacterium]|nr:DUF1670 domain-containing protein [Chloroflexota bacterium]
MRQALLRMLEEDYGLLGSRRVLELLAVDVEKLIERHYPASERVGSGAMMLTATRASSKEDKGRPGRGAGEYDLVTLAWPVVTAEDIESLRTLPPGPGKGQTWREIQKRRLGRLIEHGLKHPEGPAYLTLADLSLLTGLSMDLVSRYVEEVRKETGQALPTMGYRFDIGMRPTHKREIIALYEAGTDEAEIARRSGHSQASVGRSIRDDERVKLLLSRQVAPGDIAPLMMLAPTVVAEHVGLVQKYHPELAPQALPPTQPG